MAIEYRELETTDYEAAREFLASVGWAERIRDRDLFAAMMDNAWRTLVAFDGERVVGFARAVSDGVSNGYLSMVAVAADKRRQGIGRMLVEHLIASDEGAITWVLRAGHGSQAFWERLGFTKSSIAMERVRRQEFEDRSSR